MKKIILTTALIGFSLLGTCQAYSRYRNTGIDTAAKQINLGPTQLTTLNIAYPGTTIVYLKFYDSYSKPYAHSSTPVLTIQVGTDATLSYYLKSLSSVYFTNGCWVRCCTSISDTATVGVQPSTKPLIEITY